MSGVTSWIIMDYIFLKNFEVAKYFQKPDFLEKIFHILATIREHIIRFTYKHLDATRWSTSSFCKDFSILNAKDISSEVDRTRRYNTLACLFPRFNVTRLFSLKVGSWQLLQRQEKI